MKKYIIELSKDNIDIIKYENIIAVTIAEGGAMGEANGFYAMDNNCVIYHLNFRDTDIPIEQLHHTFPVLETFNCFFENVYRLDKGWGWFNMGFGNYLLVREKLYNQTKEYIDKNLTEYYAHGELYNKWYDILKIINENNSIK